jgi:hypothetical protein
MKGPRADGALFADISGQSAAVVGFAIVGEALASAVGAPDALIRLMTLPSQPLATAGVTGAAATALSVMFYITVSHWRYCGAHKIIIANRIAISKYVFWRGLAHGYGVLAGVSTAAARRGK